LAGNYDDSSSSSSSEVTSGFSDPLQQASFLQLEASAFQRLHVDTVPRPLHLPLVLDRFTLPQLHSVLSKGLSFSEASDNSLAIVPFRPSLHAVLISLWAASQPAINFPELSISVLSSKPIAPLDATAVGPSDDTLEDNPTETSMVLGTGYPVIEADTETNPVHDMLHVVETASSAANSDALIMENPAPPKKCLTPLLDAVATAASAAPLPLKHTGKVSLPEVVSKSKLNKSLTIATSRRSPRLNRTEGFLHVQLAGSPNKRRKCQVVVVPTAGPSCDNPPKPSDEAPPAPVPLEIMQSWGLQCGVPPGEMAQDALLNTRVDNDEDTA